MAMTADYAIPLKGLWRIVSDWTCTPECQTDGDYCEGHAAVLEMVDAVHLPRCLCGTIQLGPVSELWAKCREERRRLRAAVGVDE